MKNKATEAIEVFKNDYNCSQSVLSVFAEELGINKDVALKICNPFGAGIAYMQECCGAVSGALMAIGLAYGKGEHGSNDDKAMAYEKAKHFIAEFKKIHNSVCCRELLDNHDMNTPEGIEKIYELDLFRQRCAIYIQDAVRITEKVLK
ncbi:MAG: C_GCAxxG_C_C family protein [Bacteroidetes bacterium]|nr:C_GCAxxG_C_C family protein [Bacteroidota bacterium]